MPRRYASEEHTRGSEEHTLPRRGIDANFLIYFFFSENMKGGTLKLIICNIDTATFFCTKTRCSSFNHFLLKSKCAKVRVNAPPDAIILGCY